MDEALKKRFTRQKIEDLRSNNTQPYPTILCERDDPRIMELVRRYCMFSEKMIPYRGKGNLVFVEERLDIQKEKTDFGDLYIWVSDN